MEQNKFQRAILLNSKKLFIGFENSLDTTTIAWEYYGYFWGCEGCECHFVYFVVGFSVR